jgi:thiol-disulfide isomerase/thioredoxin
MWFLTEKKAARVIFSPPDRGRDGGIVRRVRSIVPCLLVVLACWATSVAEAQVKVGDAFPSLASAELSGGTVPETQGRVVLVDFWASWCAPCKASFPAFAKIHADYAAKGLVIVAVSVDEKAAAYASFVKKFQPPFATLHDAKQMLVNEVKVPTMPTSYLIGRDGRVRFVHSGVHGGATERELREHIDVLLEETK